MEFNLADLFENAVDHFGDRECIVANGKTRSFKEMDERANRLAHHLSASGVGPGDHVGIYAYNTDGVIDIAVLHGVVQDAGDDVVEVLAVVADGHTDHVDVLDAGCRHAQGGRRP